MLIALLGVLPSCSLLFDQPGDATPGVCEEAAGLFDVVNTLGDVDDPSVSSDGMTLFFNLRADSLESIWRATRQEPCAPWSNPEELDLGHDDVDNPTLGNLGNCLYYDSDEIGYSVSPDFGETEALAIPGNVDGVFGMEPDVGCATRYLVDRGGSIYIEEPGTESRILDLGTAGLNGSPWLAPNSSPILFVSEYENNSEVYIAEANGELSFGVARRLSDVGEIVSDPWLTSGLIYAVRGRVDERQLFVLGALP